MIKFLSTRIIDYIVLAILTLWYILTLSSVPFHPDESTYRFMSQDLDQIIKSPTSAIYQPDEKMDLMMHYRLVDPPMVRYLAWISLKFAGYPLPEADWDWSKTWNENESSGALPSTGELFALRLPTTILVSISVLLFYRITQFFKRLAIQRTATLLYAMSPLLLLHGRRAMGEGVMLFSIVVTIYWLLFQKKHLWLAAIPLALAINSKQSTLPLVALFLLVLLFNGFNNKLKVNLVKQLLLFSLLFAGLTYLLNPFMWLHPMDSIKTSIHERQALVSSQVEMLKQTNPEKYLGSPWLRGASLVVNLFITKPATADVANYLDNTREADNAYLANPMNSFLGGLIRGGIYLIVFLFSFLVILINFKKMDFEQQEFLLISTTGFILLFGALAIVVPIPYQRYCMPLLPFVVLIVGQGLDIVFPGKPTIISHN